MNILKKLTKEYLKMNKKRTLVTIIGVILTGAMISGVTTLAASFQNFLVETQKQDSGNWEVCFQDVSYENAKYIENNKDFKNTFFTQVVANTNLVGEVVDELEQPQEIRVMAYDNNAIKNLNIKANEGRLPEKSSELILPSDYMKQNSNFKIGDSIKLSTIGNLNSVTDYTIVGTSDSYRLRTQAGYKVITFLDIQEITNQSTLNISATAKNVNKLYEQVDEVCKNLNLYQTEDLKSEKIAYNNSLLMYEGVNNEDGFGPMVISVCAVLILVIAIGSIVVIYNSFAISVSERKRQFGMLASIGATKKQIKKMVLYEGVIVGAIGIPLGILSGILGIGVTLKVVDSLISPLFADSQITAHFELVVSYIALLIAVVLIAITIYLSVFVPAKKASKTSPIETIRGVGDIKIKARKVKTPKFLRKLYGIEGDMALKNLKRSRKRYRTTVISLTISIVLFLTFNGFVTYMFEGFDALYMTVPYDYELSITTQENDDLLLAKELVSMNNVKKIVYEKYNMCFVQLDDNNINNNLKNIISDNKALKSSYQYENGKGTVPAYVVALDDKSFEEYAKSAGVTNLEDDSCILTNFVDGLYMYKAQFNIFNYKENAKLPLKLANMYIDTSNSQIPERQLDIVKITEEAPYGIPTIAGYAIIVVNNNTFNEISHEKNIFEEMPINTKYVEVLAETDNIEAVEANVENIMQKYPEVSYHGYDVKEQMAMIKNLKLIIEIFLYGFIVLISLIGISNIFNTITTNVNLRRREFANLKSIGMTDKAFNKMMNLECLFYGSKSLLYGLPIGCIMCYLLSKAFSSEIMFMFRIPWSSIAIVVVVVYLIVFMTMRYARNKIKKENIIDVLRDDNI